MSRMKECAMRNWGHRFVLIGYLCTAIGAWLLARKPNRVGFICLAVGSTLQLIGGLLQH
jgi:hypothetical protein